MNDEDQANPPEPQPELVQPAVEVVTQFTPVPGSLEPGTLAEALGVSGERPFEGGREEFIELLANPSPEVRGAMTEAVLNHIHHRSDRFVAFPAAGPNVQEIFRQVVNSGPVHSVGVEIMNENAIPRVDVGPPPTAEAPPPPAQQPAPAQPAPLAAGTRIVRGYTCSVCQCPIDSDMGICSDCSERAAVPTCLHCGCMIAENTGICADCAQGFNGGGQRRRHLGTITVQSDRPELPIAPPREEEEDSEEENRCPDCDDDPCTCDDNDDDDDEDTNEDTEFCECPHCNEEMPVWSNCCPSCTRQVDPIRSREVTPMATATAPAPVQAPAQAVSLVNNIDMSDLDRTSWDSREASAYRSANDQATSEAIVALPRQDPDPLYEQPALAVDFPEVSGTAYGAQTTIQAHISHNFNLHGCQLATIYEAIYDGVLKGFLQPSVFTSPNIKGIFTAAFATNPINEVQRIESLMLELRDRNALGYTAGFQGWIRLKMRTFAQFSTNLRLQHNQWMNWCASARYIQRGYVQDTPDNWRVLASAFDQVSRGNYEQNNIHQALRDAAILSDETVRTYSNGRSYHTLVRSTYDNVRGRDFPNNALESRVASFAPDQQLFFISAACWLARNTPLEIVTPERLLASRLPTLLFRCGQTGVTYSQKMEAANTLFLQMRDDGLVDRPMYSSMPTTRIPLLRELLRMAFIWQRFMATRQVLVSTTNPTPIGQIPLEAPQLIPVVRDSAFDAFVKKSVDELHNLPFMMPLDASEKKQLGVVLKDFFGANRCNAKVLSSTLKALQDGEFFRDALSEADKGSLFTFLSRTMGELTGNKNVVIPTEIKTDLQAPPFRRLYDAAEAMMNAYQQHGVEAAKLYFDGLKDAFNSIKPEEVPVKAAVKRKAVKAS